MKKIIAIVMALLLCLSLVACVQDPDVTTATGEINATTSSDPAATTTPIVLDIDLTNKWTQADVEYNGTAAFSEAGYYYAENGILHFMDTENGISVVLCHKAGCKHSKDECDAYLGGATQIMFYSDGYLYYDQKVRDDPNSVHLFRRKADGTAKEKFAVLGQDYISPKVSIGIGEYLATDGAVYFTAYTMETVEVKPGHFTTMERDGILLRLDLDTGKQEEILRKSAVLIRVFGARQNAVLFYTQDTLPAEEIGESDYYERIEKLPARLLVWSASADGCVTLFEKPNRECKWIVGLQGSKLYYTDDVKYYTYDLATEIHTELAWTEYYELVNENYLFDSDGDTPEDEVLNYAKFIDLRTGEFVPSAYDDADMRIVNRTDRGCVIEINYYGEPIPMGSGSHTIPRLRQIVAYVAFDALEDGLQESDLLVISDETFKD